MRSIILVLCGLALVAAVSIHHTMENHAEGQSTLVPPAPSSKRAISARGLIEGNERERALRFEITGRLKSVEVAEGDRVKAGEALAQIEPSTWVHELAKAQASLTSALAEKERLVNGARKETRDYAHAQTRMAQARVNQLGKRVDRAVQLLERSAISQQEVDDFQGSFEVAQAELDAAIARAREADAPARNDEVRIAEARIALEEARLREAQTTLQRTRLVAPCDGIILRVRGEPGELVGPEVTEPIIIMVDKSETKIRAFIEEMDALNVAAGQRAYAMTDGMPGVKFWGSVVSCSPYMAPKRLLSNAPGERQDVKVREVVIVVDPQDKLVVGLPVDVFIEPDDARSQSGPPL